MNENVVVLFVEDDEFARKLLSMAVRGYSCYYATDGKEAMDFYETYNPDIVFLDIGLPDTSGKEVLQKLKARNPNVYVVMTSGESYRENVIDCIRGGAKGFIAKPFSAAQFNMYIQRYREEKEASSKKQPV